MYHVDTIRALHEERRHRLEAEAARYALTRALRRRPRWWWRRPRGMQPAWSALHFRSISIDMLGKRL
jgi:hypothetical protein